MLQVHGYSLQSLFLTTKSLSFPPQISLGNADKKSNARVMCADHTPSSGILKGTTEWSLDNFFYGPYLWKYLYSMQESGKTVCDSDDEFQFTF